MLVHNACGNGKFKKPKANISGKEGAKDVPLGSKTTRTIGPKLVKVEKILRKILWMIFMGKEIGSLKLILNISKYKSGVIEHLNRMDLF